MEARRADHGGAQLQGDNAESHGKRTEPNEHRRTPACVTQFLIKIVCLFFSILLSYVPRLDREQIFSHRQRDGYL